MAGFLAVSVAKGADDGAAERGSLPWEKGSVMVGGFVSTFDSTLTFGLENRGGVEFNAEDRLGLDSTLTVIRAEGMYRPSPNLRHQIDLSYGGYHRDGEATLSESFTLGGTTYPVGADVKTVFDFDVIRSTYTYAVLQNERARVAIGLGAYVLPVKYGLDVQTGGGRSHVEGADTVVPLPSLALRGEFQLIPKLFLNAGIDGMYLEVSDLKGVLLEPSVNLEYRPWEHVGFGVGYSGMLVKVESKNGNSSYPGDNFVGTVDVKYHGLVVYGKFLF